jgi:hypothetical protein
VAPVNAADAAPWAVLALLGIVTGLVVLLCYLTGKEDDTP